MIQITEEVTVYTTNTCTYCEKVKEFLEKKDISYTEHNVQQNPEKAREMIQKTGQRGVPVTQVGRKIVIGFNKQKLKELLGI